MSCEAIGFRTAWSGRRARCYGAAMHRSRLSTLLIDAPTDDAGTAATFWSAALGVPAQPAPDEDQFTDLPGAVPDLVLAVQAVDDQPRYHVDIETDDVEAETARLTGLGAVEINCWLDCHILRAPGGHLLCVIPQHSDPETFERTARVWP
jgi:hypothetical protein